MLSTYPYRILDFYYELHSSLSIISCISFCFWSLHVWSKSYGNETFILIISWHRKAKQCRDFPGCLQAGALITSALQGLQNWGEFLNVNSTCQTFAYIRENLGNKLEDCTATGAVRHSLLSFTLYEYSYPLIVFIYISYCNLSFLGALKLEIRTWC